MPRFWRGLMNSEDFFGAALELGDSYPILAGAKGQLGFWWVGRDFRMMFRGSWGIARELTYPPFRTLTADKDFSIPAHS